MRAVGAALLAGIAAASAAEMLKQHSFQPPFQEFDTFGKRVVPYWEVSGATFANRHFIRLTPDRQSKRGTFWNNQPLNSKDWSALIKFRVSGQGRTLFGDGFAFWLAKGARFMEGPFFGVTDRFEGMAVIFDTFKNTELAHVHKDIAVVLNDGRQSGTEKLEQDLEGCSASYRYHEGRDDFSVANVSFAKITYKGGTLMIKVDETGTGHWRTCATVANLAVAPETFSGAYFGLSASTGQLADNHDVLSVQLFSLGAGEDEAPNPEQIKEVDPEEAKEVRDLPGMVEKFAKKHLKTVREEIEHLQHDLEHQLTAVDDHTQVTLKKLKEQEDGMEQRIKELERRVEQLVSQRMDQLQGNVDDRIQSASMSWLLPFVVFATIVGGVMYFAYRKYNYLVKTHLL